MKKNNTYDKETVLKDIRRRLNKWRRGANLLSIGLIVLGFLAIAGSIFVSAFIGTGTIENTYIRIISITSTAFFTLINSFNLKSMASNVRNGWKHLNTALYEYDCSEQKNIDALITAYKEGENMLGTVEFNFSKSEEKKDN